MIKLMASKKIIMPLIGLISGIMLFLALLSTSVDATIFNSDYQMNTLKELGIASLLTDKLHEAADYQTSMGSYIKNRVTEDLIDFNIRSLVDGLFDYIKGTSDTLPYLYLNNQTDALQTSFEDEISLSPISTLSKIDKVNLNLLFMFYDDDTADDLLKVASLFEYLIRNIMITSLLSFILISIIMLCQKVTVILDWFKATVITCAPLCLIAAYLVTAFKNSGYYRFKGSFAYLNEFVEQYISITTYSLINHLFLSFGLIITILYIILYWIKKARAPLIEMSLLRKRSRSWIIAIILALLSTAVVTQIGSAAKEYSDRDMEQAVMFIKGNNLKTSADAKNNDVCFLKISVNDSLTGEPVKDAELNICQNGSNEDNSQKTVTDNEGSSVLLLKKGSYRLTIDIAGSYAFQALNTPAVYDFEMVRPGRTELRIILDRQNDTAMQIKSATLEYIP